MAYIDGVGIVVNKEIPEITPDYSAGGVSAADAAEALATATKAWEDISITMEMAAEGIQKFFHAMVMAVAVRCAMVLEPAMAHRYLHTKKKRIRKKYEKRIMAWYREVFL